MANVRARIRPDLPRGNDRWGDGGAIVRVFRMGSNLSLRHYVWRNLGVTRGFIRIRRLQVGGSHHRFRRQKGKLVHGEDKKTARRLGQGPEDLGHKTAMESIGNMVIQGQGSQGIQGLAI